MTKLKCHIYIHTVAIQAFSSVLSTRFAHLDFLNSSCQNPLRIIRLEEDSGNLNLLVFKIQLGHSVSRVLRPLQDYSGCSFLENIKPSLNFSGD